MLPPSPHAYYPRFSQHSSISNGNPLQTVNREPPPPPPPPSTQHRPSGSMSISSMLGSEFERPSRDQIPTSAAAYQPKPSHPFSEMSPPQHSVNPSPGEYSYKPRSQTPDRMGISNLIGTRPYRSGSGSIMQSSRPFEDSTTVPSGTPFPRFGEAVQQPPNQEQRRRTEESFNHTRRTSLSGILQRPSSQPQPQVQSNFQGPRLQPANHAQATRAAWHEQSNTQSSMNFNSSSSPSFGLHRAPEYAKEPQNGQSVQSAVPASQYDIRPPPFSPSIQQPSSSSKVEGVQSSAPAWDRSFSNATTPDARRHPVGPSQHRPSAGLLNGQVSITQAPAPTPASAPAQIQPQSQSQENQRPASVPMSQQDSTQSNSERSIFGERLDKSRSRLFSPFAGSHTSQSGPSASGLADEQSRKGSDELSQHRALLGLAAEGKRGGRYSPLPQAVQGAQAQSIGPEMGIKSEHGRIFSGIGSGVGTSSASPAHAPPGLASSPFKRDDSNGSRLLNEDNIMKISRSSSGFGKRARKVKEEDGKAASENDGNGRNGKKARTHQ
jgi:hypothetical protein